VKRKLTVKIPAGIQSGQAVRVQGEGEPPATERSPGGQGIRGDLHVVVRVRPHKRFERDGDHLLLAVPVSFAQLALGATVEVPTLEGRSPLAIPAGTQHGAMFRIAGKGLPALRSGARGDLVVIVQLVVPRSLNDEQRELLEAYAHTEDLDIAGDGKSSFWGKIKDAMTGG
jgi:molecular chaperone DnaJ